LLLLDVALLEHAVTAMATAEIHRAITAMRLCMRAILSYAQMSRICAGAM
jgi:hypothetical protein